MKLDAKLLCKHIVTRDICPSSSFLKKAAMFVHHRIVTKELLNLHRVDKLKNFAANILIKLVC